PGRPGARASEGTFRRGSDRRRARSHSGPSDRPMSGHREQFLSSNLTAVGPPGDLEEFSREHSRFQRLLPTRTPLSVLDIGCGSGPWSVRWVEYGARVTGLDFDPDLLRLALRRPGVDARTF